MEFNVGVPVDAGCFVLIDYDNIKEWLCNDETRLGIREGDISPIYQKGPIRINLGEGFYSIVYKASCWTGAASGQTHLNIKSGKLIVADLCHIVDPYKWQDFLEKTNYLRNFSDNPHAVVVNTGGDGNFAVKLEIKKLVSKGKK